MKKYDVITIGSATKDVFLIADDFKLVKSSEFVTGFGECFSRGSKMEIGKMYFDTGGGATNAAATFANLGLKTAVICRVGDDPAGEEVKKAMKQKKVDTQFMVTCSKHETGYSTVFLAKNGERTVLVFRGASAFLTKKDVPIAKCQGGWIYLTSLNGNMDLLSWATKGAKRKKMQIALNPGGKEIRDKKIYSILPQADVLILNKSEAEKLAKVKTREARFLFLALHRHLNGIIVITDGDNGAYVSNRSQIFFANTEDVKRVNATGAGDAFGSGFVAGLIQLGDIKKALALAMINSQSVIQKMGAKKGLLEKMPSQKKLNSVPIKELS